MDWDFLIVFAEGREPMDREGRGHGRTNMGPGLGPSNRSSGLRGCPGTDFKVGTRPPAYPQGLAGFGGAGAAGFAGAPAGAGAGGWFSFRWIEISTRSRSIR